MISPALLDVYAQQERLCTYFDMPMQHASDRLLRTMKRGYTQRTLCRLLDNIRQRLPEATIRSTFIVGFPGERQRMWRSCYGFWNGPARPGGGLHVFAGRGTPSMPCPTRYRP